MMKISSLGEFGLIEQIRRTAARDAKRVRIGIGDDAAALVLSPASALLATTDMLLEGVHFDLAMTGEVTLRGRVLPIGGLKEKTLAARRAGITTVIIPKQNEKDLDDIPKEIRKDMKFVFAETMDDVINMALRKKLPRRIAHGRKPGRSRATH